jgi:hypothetical protein
MSGIFVSYRRGDTAGEAGRLADHLRDRFGPDQVFIDVETVEPGQDFVTAIQRALDSCTVVLVVVGDQWLSALDDRGRRRLDDPEDFVHQEVVAALRRDGVRVIPVLVQRATMPRASDLPAPLADLNRRNALEIRDTHFRRDVDALIDVVVPLVPGAAGTPARVLPGVAPRGTPPTSGRRRPLAVLAIAGGLAAAVLVAVVAYRLGPVPRPDPVSPTPAEPSNFGLRLRVKLDPKLGAVEPPPFLTLWHRKPEKENKEQLEPRDSVYRTDPVSLPAKGAEFLGVLRRATTHASFQSDPGQGNTRVCIERKVDRLPQGQPGTPTAWLQCQEGGQCEVDRDDPGWVGPCKSPSAVDRPGWVARAHAQAGAPQEPGWVVPSLQTLRKIAGTKDGIGYTEFTLRTDPIPGLGNADGVTYAIRVNGNPVYIDGWPEEAWRVPFDAAQGLRLEFSLANLDFSGHDQGREDIDIALKFAKGKQVLRTEKVRLAYVALRPACGQTVKSADGLTVYWQANYIGAQPGDRWQIFVASPPDGRAAQALKNKIDGARLRLDGQEMVGVIRPPLVPGRPYGVGLGLRQPSGQVKFTFDDTTSQRLLADATRLAPTTGGVLSTSIFRREVDRNPVKPCPDA